MTDYSFAYNYNEGELINSANYYYGPHLKNIPHEPLHNDKYNQKLLNMGPTRTITLNTYSNDKVGI